MNYQLNSYVNRQEAEALKEIIFKRAKERANAMTSDVQADIMNIARDSFVSNKNPFAQFLAPAEELTSAVREQEKVVKSEEKTSVLHEYTDAMEEAAQEVGFPIKDLFSGAVNQNKMIKEQAIAAQVQSTMIEAREGLTNKKSFMGALDFLNSQAAASLLNKRAGRGIDVVA